jgi:hypothetical protein
MHFYSIVKVFLIVAIITLFVTSINISLQLLNFHVNFPLTKSKCSIEGPNSAAPLNYLEFQNNLEKIARKIEQEGYDKIVYTTVNYEAAKNNLPYFLQSIDKVQPSMLRYTVVLCIDKKACLNCKLIHFDYLCIYMDFGIGTGSLTPYLYGEELDLGYFRLTMGRFYAALKILQKNYISVLSVDVDAVFLKNPFATNEILSYHPYLAIVADTQYLNLTDKASVPNGGFVYLPAVTRESWHRSVELMKYFWRYNCHSYKQNDQMILAVVLRRLTQQYKKKGLEYPITLLPISQFLSYCNTKCGNATMFKTALSYNSLVTLENSYKNLSVFEECSPERRKQWVYFHACCIIWPDGNRSKVSEAKKFSQGAVLEWVRRS